MSALATIEILAKKDIFSLQFMSNWTDASTGVARWWFIALHVNLEFKSCLLKRSTTISLRRLRPLGTRKVSLETGLPSRSQVTFGVGRPPNTSHFSFIVFPSLYGPTTLFRSVFDSSRILMRSGGTAILEKTEQEEGSNWMANQQSRKCIVGGISIYFRAFNNSRSLPFSPTWRSIKCRKYLKSDWPTIAVKAVYA